MSLKEVIKDVLYNKLEDALYCDRSWEAWECGSMTEGDFSNIREDDSLLDEISDEIISKIKKEVN